MSKSVFIKCTFLLFFIVNMPCFAQSENKVFTFKYKKDDNYRILSKVVEDVFINNKKNHTSEIVSRVSIHITDVNSDGTGFHEASFMTSDSSVGSVTGKNLTWDREYFSKYAKNRLGKISIDDKYFMPVVRDMPVFPDKPLSKGDSWNATGYEAHDLRHTFNLEKPLCVPFEALYTYEGEQIDSTGKKLDIFTVNYNLYFEGPAVQENILVEYPETTIGYSKQTLFWDSEKGALDHYTEDFKITIITSNGNVYKFVGKTEAEITEFKRTVDDVERVWQEIEKLELENVQVKSSDKGLTISLENIQFKPDSSVLQESEKEKIRSIAQILQNYPNNDILVSGFTALAGTQNSRLALSKERAKAVADFLVELGVKDLYHIFTQGYGAENPVASNESEEGRARNRRVEITILD